MCLRAICIISMHRRKPARACPARMRQEHSAHFGWETGCAPALHSGAWCGGCARNSFICMLYALANDDCANRKRIFADHLTARNCSFAHANETRRMQACNRFTCVSLFFMLIGHRGQINKSVRASDPFILIFRVRDSNGTSAVSRTHARLRSALHAACQTRVSTLCNNYDVHERIYQRAQRERAASSSSHDKT